MSRVSRVSRVALRNTSENFNFIFCLDSSWVIIGGCQNIFAHKWPWSLLQGSKVRFFENFGKIFFWNCIKTKGLNHYGLKIYRSENLYGNIRDQALYDHYIKKLIKPKEKKFLVPKGHFHFSKFATLGPHPSQTPESQAMRPNLKC